MSKFIVHASHGESFTVQEEDVQVVNGRSFLITPENDGLVNRFLRAVGREDQVEAAP